MLVSDIVGHDRAKRVLLNALAEGRVAHAYLFHGPAGVGKSTLARAFAGALLCESGSGDSCGQCSVCRRVAEERFPDFFVLSPAGNSIKIEQVRELQKKAQFKPYEARKKVYIIDGAETMTTEAANCLLKILEDPPPDTVFLLTAVNQYSLLPTIISRCQLIPLTKVPVGQIEEMLMTGCQINPDEAALLASLSDGLPGAAREMAASGKGLETRQTVLRLVEQIRNGNINDLLKTAEEFENKKEDLPEILEQLLLWYRDQIIWLETGEEKLILNIDQLENLKNFARESGKARIVQSIRNILEAKNHVSRNVNLKLTLEVMLLRLARTA